MLPRTMQIACLSFFMAVTAEGWASLSVNFKDINIYSLMPLLFITSASGKPVENITTIDSGNKTITDFNLKNNETKTINLNKGDQTITSFGNKTVESLEDETISLLTKNVSALERQVLSLKTQRDTDDINGKIDQLIKDVKSIISRVDDVQLSFYDVESTVNTHYAGFVVVSIIWGVIVFLQCFTPRSSKQ